MSWSEIYSTKRLGSLRTIHEERLKVWRSNKELRVAPSNNGRETRRSRRSTMATWAIIAPRRDVVGTFSMATVTMGIITASCSHNQHDCVHWIHWSSMVTRIHHIHGTTRTVVYQLLCWCLNRVGAPSCDNQFLLVACLAHARCSHRCISDHDRWLYAVGAPSGIDSCLSQKMAARFFAHFGRNCPNFDANLYADDICHIEQFTIINDICGGKVIRIIWSLLSF